MDNFKNCKWIAASKAETGPAPMFRKTFDIEKTVKKATLYACGLGYGLYYINGQSVTDDVLLTPVTRYDLTVLYNSYDVTTLIKLGKNAVGAMLGNGWYCTLYPRWDTYKAPWFHHPKMILDLEIEFTDGSCTHIKSDSSWSVADGPIIYNETRRGEIYDARLETDGFFDADFNDSHLNKAFICRSPGGIMKKTSIPPIKVIKEIKPTKISDNVYDLGQNISGWVKIIVKGTPGTEITLRYSELLHSDGSINPEELSSCSLVRLPFPIQAVH